MSGDMKKDNGPQNAVANEVWIEVAEDDIDSLIDMLSKFRPISIHFQNFIIENFVLSKKSEKTEMKILFNKSSPETIIAIAKGCFNRAVVFSPQKNYALIETAFRERQIINWLEGPLVLCGIDVAIGDFILKTIPSYGWKIDENRLTYECYWVTEEISSGIDVECPPDMYFSKLEECHATIVNANWPYANNNSLEIIQEFIKYKESIGLFTNKDSLLVAWILNTHYGVGMLHTIDEYRKRGYGTLVTKKIIKDLSNLGRIPHLLTLPENAAARSIILSIGLIKTEPVIFFRVEKL